MIPWVHEGQKVEVDVIGDIILDEYLKGEVQRISPEAPVPIHRVTGTFCSAGGAANVAVNICLAGGQASLHGVCGRDQAGEQVINLLKEADVNYRTVLQDSKKDTIKKTRILSANQQLLRVDWEQPAENHKDYLPALLEQLNHSTSQAILVSDYGKGMLSRDFLSQIIDIAKSRKVPVVVDPKSKDFSRYAGCDLITPNFKEASAALDLKGAENNPESVEAMARRIQEQFQISNVLITMGHQGMLLLTAEKDVHYIQAQSREVYDVSGAGDTVASIMALTLASKTNWQEAVNLANTAAGVVVQKLGTQPIQLSELQEALQQKQISSTTKIITENETLRAILKKNHLSTDRLIFTNGCFDIMHAGHVRYLEQAKARGDILVVAVNTDASVRKLKGNTRPVIPLQERMELLAALSCVDYVTCFNTETPAHLIDFLEPDVLVKGSDYEIKDIVGSNTVLKRGGEVARMPLLEGVSTSEIVKRIQRLPPQQEKT